MRATEQLPTREELRDRLRQADQRVGSLRDAYASEHVEDLTEHAELDEENEDSEAPEVSPGERSGVFEIRRDSRGELVEARSVSPGEQLKGLHQKLEEESRSLGQRYFSEVTELASIERELESLERARQAALLRAETTPYRVNVGTETIALDEQIEQLRYWRDGQARVVAEVSQRIQKNEEGRSSLRPHIKEREHIEAEQKTREEVEAIQREIFAYENLLRTQDQQSAILANRAAEAMARAQAMKQNLDTPKGRLSAETKTAEGWFGWRRRDQVKVLREQMRDQERESAEADGVMKETFAEIAQNNKSVEQIMNGSDQAQARLRIAMERLARLEGVSKARAA